MDIFKTECNCNPVGSKSQICNVSTGKCECYETKTGKTCNQCLPGFYDPPKCKPCNCNGLSNQCDSKGHCIACKENSEGSNCER